MTLVDKIESLIEMANEITEGDIPLSYKLLPIKNELMRLRDELR